MPISGSLNDGGDHFPINIEVCGSVLRWITLSDTSSRHTQIISDIIPVTESFSNILYNPYSILDSEEGVIQRLFPCEEISTIKGVLLEHFNEFQTQYIKSKFPPGSSIFECYFDNHRMRGFISLVSKSHIQMEFPLLEQSRLSCPDIEYLLQLLESSPIILKFRFSFSDNSCTASVQMPSILPCSKTIEFPPYNDNMTPRDYHSLVENILSMKLSQRRNFILEMRKIAAVLEFDAVDFSFVSVGVRMRSASMFSLCVADIRLSSTFPESLPLVSVHDLASGSSHPLASSLFSQINLQQDCDLLCKDVLLVICRQVFQQAFQ